MTELEKIKELTALYIQEGFEVVGNKVYHKNKEIPFGIHPYQVWLRAYKELPPGEEKYQAMKKVHDWLWPKHIYHNWTERRFKAHCGDWDQVILTSGASTGKSYDSAKIAIMFWLCDPHNTAAIVCSTTLESLETRVWGYICKLLEEIDLPVPFQILRGKPPKVLLPGQTNKLTGMFATAIKLGESDAAIANLIGRHPRRLLVLLDEATDISYSILKAIPNLEKGTDAFQVIAIGNANSKSDLHGSLATPKNGWESIHPERDKIWPTQHAKGICLYFSPYDSPAITHPDPEIRAKLGRFLITQKGLDLAIATYGKDSDSYWRFVLGFWRSQTLDQTIVSAEFAAIQQLHIKAEWSGRYPLVVCGGLDIAFSIGGTGCCLRLAMLGQDVSGLMVLDFRQTELLFMIELKSDVTKAGEIQIAEQVLEILAKYNCPLRNLAYDGTGVGRAMGGLLTQMSGQSIPPHKIVSRRPPLRSGTSQNKKAIIEPFTSVIPASELWMGTRKFIEHKQLRGLDHQTIAQLTSRRVVLDQSQKLVVETKKQYIERMAAVNPALKGSPDEADSAILCLHSAIINFGFFAGQKRDLGPAIDPTQSLWHQKQMAQAIAVQEIKKSENKFRPRLVPNFATDMGKMVKKRVG